MVQPIEDDPDKELSGSSDSMSEGDDSQDDDLELPGREGEGDGSDDDLRQENRKSQRRRLRESQQANRRLSQEVRQLSERLAQIEGAAVEGQRQRDVAEKLTEVASKVTAAKAALREATDSGDSERIAEATQSLFDAQLDERVVRASATPQGGTEERARTRSPAAPQVPTGPLGDWLKRHSWYGDERDTSADATIDRSAAFAAMNALQKEGFDPRDDEFVEELDKRLKSRMPHRYQQQRRRDALPTADDGRAAPGGDGAEPVITEAKKRLWRTNGLDWNNPKQRAEIMRYERETAARLKEYR